MRHLSPEELLLHCDSALTPELAAHLDECPACRESWLSQRLALHDAVEGLRASVPPEPLANKAASRVSLEHALYPPQTGTGFPLKWPAVYATAAALTLTVLGGFLTTRQNQLGDRAPQIAANLPASPPPIFDVPGQPAREVGAETAARSEASQGQPLAFDRVSEPSIPAEALAEESSALSLPEPAAPARFELGVLARREVGSRQVAWVEPPAVAATTPAADAVLAFWPPAAAVAGIVSRPAQERPDAVPASAASTTAIIEGYWILTEARVWDEDLRPVWTPGGLRIEGSVEDAATRDRVQAAVARQASAPVSFGIGLREQQARANANSADRSIRVVTASYSGPVGGTVRRALLSHFEDSARRSFVAPRPSELEAELVRYTSEIFRQQSELLGHVYAVQRFLERVDPDLVASADATTIQRFREVVRFHLGALDEREAAIYDRMSEALPRRFWTYRGERGSSSEVADWRSESESLLQDSLRFDSRLTALFGSAPVSVDIGDLDLSCGELLHRIRTHIRRIKSQTQAL